MKNVVVLSGAGISAESGIKTFRDDDGLWNSHRFEDLATPEAWERNPQLVLDFYNARRKQLFEVKPNNAHFALALLETHFHVDIVTQNVDDLHEQAGSTKVLHLHGELKKARSTTHPETIITLENPELNLGDLCEHGSQLRPHIVWFGEAVPNITPAIQRVKNADFLLVIGTSMQVYPAAGLVDYAAPHCKTFLIDPKAVAPSHIKNITVIREKASTAVVALCNELIHSSKFQ